eukprot:CAMPEP_0170570896 /NCGR_PEP_ID=MMETSP0224-20130122/1367_1 /TAXON_ID=285029 /ORGANISM="Togula jolla, Strain CCCM 725" /LENGTH=56 /DNA_ID=CAMNT_0010893229 /DNA_START=57 /DNA_END=227 /DNA_ORIENTATION=-
MTAAGRRKPSVVDRPPGFDGMGALSKSSAAARSLLTLPRDRASAAPQTAPMGRPQD